MRALFLFRDLLPAVIDRRLMYESTDVAVGKSKVTNSFSLLLFQCFPNAMIPMAIHPVSLWYGSNATWTKVFWAQTQTQTLETQTQTQTQFIIVLLLLVKSSFWFWVPGKASSDPRFIRARTGSGASILIRRPLFGTPSLMFLLTFSVSRFFSQQRWNFWVDVAGRGLKQLPG